ncbi:hypothetical protein [Nocardiopsis algeriensis]|uniref:DUF3558 domain-containing protein n=1 Tax=Nocardiopsis algeriensis TaxID=1478215 RepID=A0A841IPZ2_9ACTN|nr:hypothetical protein [Nocardiopsis algeriensis]MBB6120260.1 hypothetical protein [Nocardiopsis algeriensis]
MADDKAETKQKQRPKKQGLHGWKAAAAVFGCGTLAAFGVFGVIVMIAGLLVNTTSSGVDSPEYHAGVEQSGKPRESLEPGGLNLCDDYLTEISDINISEVASSSHSDDALESGYEAGDARMVSGACSFLVTPMYGVTSEWVLDFDYRAVIHSPDGDRDQSAQDIFSEVSSSAEDGFSSVESKGQRKWADSAHYFYGVAQGSVSRYMVVAQTRSAVYSVSFSGSSEDVEGGMVPEIDFERQSRDLIERLHGRFYRLIPR